MHGPIECESCDQASFEDDHRPTLRAGCERGRGRGGEDGEASQGHVQEAIHFSFLVLFC